jgi:hypothetical protein
VALNPAQRLRLRHEAVACQCAFAARRHVDDDPPDADVSDVAKTQQCVQQLGRRELARPRSQPLKPGHHLARHDVEQRSKALALASGEGVRKRCVQPIACLVAGRRDQTRQHAGAGQQHLRLDQSRGREIKQDARALRGRPGVALASARGTSVSVCRRRCELRGFVPG